jgi:hypothetical protein
MVANDNRLRPVALADAPVPAVLALVWRDAPSPALEQLVAHCRRAFAR